MADEKSYGWAGKILRVNLTTGSIHRVHRTL